MSDSVMVKKDYIWKYVLDPETGEVKAEPIIFLPKTTTDCVFFEDKDTTLDDYLKDLKINEEYGGIVIKDNTVGERTTYSSQKIEQMVTQAIITAQTSSTINGLQFSIVDGTLAVTYDDGE